MLYDSPGIGLDHCGTAPNTPQTHFREQLQRIITLGDIAWVHSEQGDHLSVGFGVSWKQCEIPHSGGESHREPFPSLLKCVGRVLGAAAL